MSGPDFYDYDYATGALTPVFITTGRRPATAADFATLADTAAETLRVIDERLAPLWENLVAVCREHHDRICDTIAETVAALAPMLTAPAYAAGPLIEPATAPRPQPATDTTPQPGWLEHPKWTGIQGLTAIAALAVALAALVIAWLAYRAM